MKIISSETETAILSIVGRLYNGIYADDARSVVNRLRVAPEYREPVPIETALESDIISEQRDLFALHAGLEEIQLAEDAILEAQTLAGITEVDPLTLRIKARYAVADKMLQVRGES
jgi:hypothetical protein